MDKPLTSTMLRCIKHMQTHGNKLVRFPGGYWAAVGWYAYSGPWYGTPTVQALVGRGVAEYTAWKDGQGKPFPITVELKKETDAKDN